MVIIMTAKVETIEELVREAFHNSNNPMRIPLARQAIYAIAEAREGDIFRLWRRLMTIAKIEKDSPNLVHWKEVIHAVGAMVYFTSTNSKKES